MSPAERILLDSSIDKVVVLTLNDGDRFLAQILIVVEEGPTPDLFCIPVDPIDHTPLGPAVGRSILLADIAHVTRAPAPGSPSSVPN